jgi:eukaryotic-like serine/threonine-protein kinase
MQMEGLLGSVVGNRYRLERVIGQGGMGAVFEATQLELGRRVAVKIVRSLDPDTLERFKREARILASLNHANIVEILDFSASEPAYLVMELLQGSSLGQALRAQSALTDVRVARIALQVLDALHETHALGLVHRDIKPDNIFLSPSSGVGDIVKLVDFGIARSQNPTGPLTLGSAMIGTLPYMSPEQATGATIDGRVDLYSLGVCMYYALCMSRPFAGATGQELLMAILQSVPQSLQVLAPQLDAPFCAIVHRAFERDPAKRFQTAREMSDALRHWVSQRESQVVSVHASGPLTLRSNPPSTLRSSEPLRGTLPAPAFTPGSGAAVYRAYAPAPAKPASRSRALPITLGAIALLGVGGGAGAYVMSLDRPKAPPAAPAVVVLAPSAARSSADVTQAVTAASEKGRAKTLPRPTPFPSVVPSVPSAVPSAPSATPSSIPCRKSGLAECPAPMICGTEDRCVTCAQVSAGKAYKYEWCEGRCAVFDNKLNCGACGRKCLGSDECINRECAKPSPK